MNDGFWNTCDRVRELLDLMNGRFANIPGAPVGDISVETVEYVNQAIPHLEAALEAITKANDARPSRSN